MNNDKLIFEDVDTDNKNHSIKDKRYNGDKINPYALDEIGVFGCDPYDRNKTSKGSLGTKKQIL